MNRNVKIEITKVSNGFIVKSYKESYDHGDQFDAGGYQKESDTRIYENKDKLIEFISSFLR